MGTRSTMTKAAVLGCSLAVAAAMTACSSDDSSTASSTSTMTTGMMSDTATSGMTTPADTAMAGLIGSGCAAYAQQVPTGPGSLDQMATEKLGVAVGNNPMLTSLAAAVSGQLNPDVNLVDTLNNGEFTVFAPVDAAFEKVPAATLDMLKTDAPALTSLLTYHVVPGQAGPDKVAGEHKTVEGGMVTVTGSGDDTKVNGASVICGGVKTANATVYLIDQVLMPPADEN